MSQARYRKPLNPTTLASIDSLCATRNLNYYLSRALRSFAEEYAHVIKQHCDEIKLEPEEIIAVQLAFLEELADIEYITGYVKKEIKCAQNSCSIDPTSFKNFIYKKASELENINTFINQQIKNTGKTITDPYADLSDQIHRVRKAINRYQNTNKAHIITDFNTEIAAISLSLDKGTDHDVIKQNLVDLVQEVQRAENKYYAGMCFFGRFRKQNSSLQACIDRAQELVTESNQAFSVRN